MTLAFNLGIFFRNMKGQEVLFLGKSDRVELQFKGGVKTFSEKTDLSRQLNITLENLPLFLHLTFEENEDTDDENNPVHVSLIRREADEDVIVLSTTFLFSEVSLKPASGDEPGPLPPSA